MSENIENRRLLQSANNRNWKKWGPYISERQWGTVREDYSTEGDAWNYVNHDLALTEVIVGLLKRELCFQKLRNQTCGST